MPSRTWILLGALGLCTIATLWCAVRSGGSAAWAQFSGPASMDVSVSGWAVRRRDKRSTPGPTEPR